MRRKRSKDTILLCGLAFALTGCLKGILGGGGEQNGEFDPANDTEDPTAYHLGQQAADRAKQRIDDATATVRHRLLPMPGAPRPPEPQPQPPPPEVPAPPDPSAADMSAAVEEGKELVIRVPSWGAFWKWNPLRRAWEWFKTSDE
jgi:hypothetical protein